MLSELNILTFNVRGIRNATKRRSIFRHIHTKYRRSIAVLQETHSSPEIETIWKNEFGGEILFSHGMSKHQGGVAICVPTSIGGVTEVLYCSENGRIIVVKRKQQNLDFTLLGVYGPSSNASHEKLAFLQEIRNALANYGTGSEIVLGDFNIRLDEGDTEASRELQNILDSFSLKDIWKEQHGDKLGFTWQRPNHKNQSRLDYIFMSNTFLNSNVIQSSVDPGIHSDHSCVTLSMKSRVHSRGPSIWRFNNSLLENNEFVDLVKAEIQKCNESSEMYQYEMGMGTRIELLFSNIRQISMKCGKNIAKQRRKDEYDYEKRITDFEKNLTQLNEQEFKHTKMQKTNSMSLRLKKLEQQ